MSITWGIIVKLMGECQKWDRVGIFGRQDRMLNIWWIKGFIGEEDL